MTTRTSDKAPRAAMAGAPVVYAFAAVAGRPSARAMARLAGLPDGGKPRLLDIDRDLSVVVADVPADVYNPEAIERQLSDLDWVAARGAAHHAVADGLFEAHPVLPLRLFTLFSTDKKAHTAMRKLRPRIRKALARLKGRREFVLRIGRPDPSRLGASPALADTSRSGGPPSGTGFLRAKAKTRRDADERKVRVSKSAAAVFDELERVADAARARTAPEGTNLLLDAAFLVSTRKTAAFRRTLSRAASDLLRDGCPVSLTGPWPPYSFASAD